MEIENKIDKMFENYYINSTEYASKNNIIIESVFSKNGNIYIKGYDKNKNRFNKEYGEFIQLYYSFIKGIKRKYNISDNLAKSNNEWIEEMKKIHPEYDYHDTVYINCHTSVKIICKKHGEFRVNPKIFAKKEYKCFKCKKEEYLEIYKKEILLKLKNYIQIMILI